MKLNVRRFDLEMRHLWKISVDLGQDGGRNRYPVVFVELTDEHGRHGLGEASPSNQYHESVETVSAFLGKVDPERLSFDRIDVSMRYLDSIAPGNFPSKCALNIALLDGAARAAGKSVHQFLGLEFREGVHQTSFTIGIDTPDKMAAKTREAAEMPVLKLKVGSPGDRENFAAVRQAAPGKPIRVDANAGWKSREEALRNIEWLAADGNVQFVEQPMPPDVAESDWIWLRDRSPLPLFGDESYQSQADAVRCARQFHGVNVKLVKTGGITSALSALEAARRVGLQTMIGCMIESSVLITAGAHLAALADYLDLDGNLLTTNDPYTGVICDRGQLSFERATERTGLCVRARP
jgi:L-alanine-DL-glutamate epimerase-like enolase superfamily enzyme